MTKKQVAELGGWAGMVLIHSATLPVTVSILLGWSDNFPPLSMVAMVCIGLALFFIRAVFQKDFLYMVSNGVGFSFQAVLLGLIVRGIY
jgi:hypothetical protein